jgi:hypothetical protein
MSLLRNMKTLLTFVCVLKQGFWTSWWTHQHHGS